MNSTKKNIQAPGWLSIKRSSTGILIWMIALSNQMQSPWPHAQTGNAPIPLTLLLEWHESAQILVAWVLLQVLHRDAEVLPVKNNWRQSKNRALDSKNSCPFRMEIYSVASENQPIIHDTIRDSTERTQYFHNGPWIVLSLYLCTGTTPCNQTWMWSSNLFKCFVLACTKPVMVVS